MSRFQCLDFNVDRSDDGIASRVERKQLARSADRRTSEMQPRLLRPAMETFGLDSGAGHGCFA
jgi:hypothetical protein